MISRSSFFVPEPRAELLVHLAAAGRRSAAVKNSPPDVRAIGLQRLRARRHPVCSLKPPTSVRSTARSACRPRRCRSDAAARAHAGPRRAAGSGRRSRAPSEIISDRGRRRLPSLRVPLRRASSTESLIASPSAVPSRGAAPASRLLRRGAVDGRRDDDDRARRRRTRARRCTLRAPRRRTRARPRRAATSRVGCTSFARIERETSIASDDRRLLALDVHLRVRSRDADDHRREREQQQRERQSTASRPGRRATRFGISAGVAKAAAVRRRRRSTRRTATTSTGTSSSASSAERRREAQRGRPPRRKTASGRSQSP